MALRLHVQNIQSGHVALICLLAIRMLSTTTLTNQIANSPKQNC